MTRPSRSPPPSGEPPRRSQRSSPAAGPPPAGASATDESGAKPSRRPNRPSPSLVPRFTLTGLLLVMFVCCCIASGGYYLARSLRDFENSRLAFTLFTLASPVVVMVVVSFLYHLTRRRW